MSVVGLRRKSCTRKSYQFQGLRQGSAKSVYDLTGKVPYNLINTIRDYQLKSPRLPQATDTIAIGRRPEHHRIYGEETRVDAYERH